jgi:hypothetical protein
MTLDHQVRPHPDVVDTELDGEETVVLHLESKQYYSLNPTGTRIWQGLKRGLNLSDISEQLQKEFAVDTFRAESSVLMLVEELAQQRLVVPVAGNDQS